ncbi:hypothetical protein C8A00DRAFT_37593 [Chaetomidium leptoderma]|uniref:Uncharacterized protein n=1 Tax=Chaetomidium leptoderma TaxID=669021 RepID=A0AAN6VEG1_9PEZI|nr:hypothetical protein C8A00DRAFT_37593 [Chaetomidium leptoderma]
MGTYMVLYLNPEYDVLCIDPEHASAPVLPDFLHDVRAYDLEDQGVTHFGIQPYSLFDYDADFNFDSATLRFTPTDLHPVASESFPNILRHKLRSVLCIVNFRTCMRGIGETQTGIISYHLAQTFPLLLYFTRTWEKLENAFGIGERAAKEDDGFRFYICPSLNWPGRMRRPEQQPLRPPLPKGLREKLAQHRREEVADWRYNRQLHWDLLLRYFPGQPAIPRHGLLVDAERFEKMEMAPSTAIGMWLFPS